MQGDYGIYINGNNNIAKNNTLSAPNPHDAGAVYVAGNANEIDLNIVNVGANLNNIVNIASGTGNNFLKNTLVGSPGGSGSAFVVGGATNTTIAYNDVTGVMTTQMLRDAGVNTMVYDNIPLTSLPDKNVPAVKIAQPS